ncbi:uroporphyrinogen-III synthase [Vibrio sp. RC27]
MNVLVIRPEEQGKALCQSLSKHGINCILHPMLDLVATEINQPLFHLEPNNDKVDIVIAVSQYAVQFCDQLLRKNNQSWPIDTRYFAIGQKTAQLLSKLSQQQVNYPQVSDSEHLLEEISLAAVSGLNIAILRGNGGRELLAETLRDRGANVIYREVYQRVPRAFYAKSNVTLWQDRQIDSIIVTSYEQLELLVSQLPVCYHHWLFSLSIYVPSGRIARLAQSTGFRNTIAVGSASNSDLVAALQPRNDRKTQ